MLLLFFCEADVVEGLERPDKLSPDEELERPDKLSPDDTSGCGSCVSKQVGDGEDGAECCGEKMGEKQSDKCTAETSDRGTDSTLRNSKAEAVGNDGEVEVSCSSQKCSSWEEPCCSSDEGSLNPSQSDQRLKKEKVLYHRSFFSFIRLDPSVISHL